MTTQDYKLLFAEVEDFKGIRHRVIEFDGRSALFIAGNAKTKSSLIDAILSPLDSTFVPTEPINNQSEEQRGVIRLIIGNDETKYEINAVYTPGERTGVVKMWKNGVKVEGAVKTKIKELLGDVSFDVYSFMNMSMSDKIDEVKRLTGKLPELNKLDEDREALAEKRKLQNHDIESMQAVNNKDNRPFTQEEIRQYESSVDVANLNKELAGMQPKIDNWIKVNNGVDESLKSVARWKTEDKVRLETTRDDLKSEVEEMELKLAQLVKKYDDSIVEINTLDTKIAEEITKINKGKEWLKKNPQPDLTDINKRIGEAAEHNRMHDIINTYRERQNKLIKTKEERDATQKEIDDLDKKKIDIIKNSKLPVDGLTWDEKMLYYNGLPFERKQLNTATYLDVGIELAMAMNTKFKLVTIREASLFDKPTLSKVLKKIFDRGYQYLGEVVDPEGNELEVKFMEKDFAE